jgi:SAM-dependent methyltransferase
MEEPLYDEMFFMEERHWWFRARREIVFSLIRRYAGDFNELKVLEPGCGCGSTLAGLSKRCRQVMGIDLSPRAIEFCRSRGVPVVQGELPGALNLSDADYDVVLLLDVLEHIDDDKAALTDTMKYLKPGGIVIACAPAFQSLWTERDAFHQHKRRYSKKAFCALFSDLPLSRQLFGFYNFFLFFPIAAARLSRKLFKYDRPGPDITLPGAPVNFLLERIFASEKLLLPFMAFPFGVSLIAVYRKR